jgi:hypothetical protein
MDNFASRRRRRWLILDHKRAQALRRCLADAFVIDTPNNPFLCKSEWAWQHFFLYLSICQLPLLHIFPCGVVIWLGKTVSSTCVGIFATYWDLGDPEHNCDCWGASFWRQEVARVVKVCAHPPYSIYYRRGRIKLLPPLMHLDSLHTFYHLIVALLVNITVKTYDFIMLSLRFHQWVLRLIETSKTPEDHMCIKYVARFIIELALYFLRKVKCLNMLSYMYMIQQMK